jgi:uncharacterized membrane protein YccC
MNSIEPSPQLKSRFGVLMWTVFIVVLLAAISYSIFFSGPGYFDGAIGNLLATIFGVILGVPAAISIERWRDRIEQSQANRDAETRKNKVLLILLDELHHNKSVLSRRLEIEETKYPHPELKFTVWQAFSNGGEIKWIADPELLTRIANAYHFIQLLNNDEEIWYRAEIERDPRQTWQSSGDRIRKHIVQIYPIANTIISQTIDIIEKLVQPPENPNVQTSGK